MVDTDSQLITAVDVYCHGNAPDNLGALELVEQSEANTGLAGAGGHGRRRLETELPGRPSPTRAASW